MRNKLTKADINKMQEEIEYREVVLRPKILEDVNTARGYGDLSENAEYDSAKEEQAGLEAEIFEIELKNLSNVLTISNLHSISVCSNLYL